MPMEGNGVKKEEKELKCSNCGYIITNPNTALYLDSEVFCCELCAETYEFLNIK